MAISNDLIAKFAKMSKESKIQRETTVFGTTVEYGGKLYVKMDGSDLLTPVETTSEIAAGERVTVMVKGHTATVTGNISNPSASKGTTDAISDEITTITATIGNFELVIADKVTTKELEAEVAKINEAIILKADIKELHATNANIDNLNANVATIDKALIGKAEIVDLNAANAEIGTLKANVANIETLIGGNLTMDNIQSLILTSSKVTVDNAFIKDAMIDRVSASKISSGSINTNIVNIGSEDGSMKITGSLQQFKDSDGNVRIQIGKDASGDFTFVLYGADGKGQLINQNGITASAITDGLIVNDMVADDAAISGTKLDISSVITEINGSTESIKSSKIYLDDKNQTLEVAFGKLESKVDLIEGVDGDLETVLDQIASNSTSINVMQGEINSLISNTTITKTNGTVIQLKDAYTATEQTVSGMSGKVSSLETNYNVLNGKMDSVNSQVASFDVTLEGFESRVSSTEVKMNSMAVGGENLLNGTTDSPTTITGKTLYSPVLAPFININDYGLKSGDTVTLRAYIHNSDLNIRPTLIFRDEEGSNDEYVIGSWFTVERVPGYAQFTTTIPEGKTQIGCCFTKYDNTATITVEYSKLKLERGSIPTDWSMSVEDMRGLVDDSTQMILDDGSVVYIKDKVTEHNVTLDSINQSVSSLETHFDANGTVTSLTQQVSTLEQFASQFTMEFFEKLNNADQGVVQLLSYIHFDADGITIGQDNYPIRLMLTKDRIKFVDANEIELAYFSEGKLYVNNAEILDTFKIGNYGFMSTANGGLTIGALS